MPRIAYSETGYVHFPQPALNLLFPAQYPTVHFRLAFIEIGRHHIGHVQEQSQMCIRDRSETSFRFHHLRNKRTSLVQEPSSNLLSANTFWHSGNEHRLQHEVTNILPTSHARSARS